MNLRQYFSSQKALLYRFLGHTHAPVLGTSFVTDNFTKLYFEEALMDGTWHLTTWLGHRCLKCPLDLWIYQEILYELRPDLVVETGTYEGGSAQFIASILDEIGNGTIVSIDIKPLKQPPHPRIKYLTGSSVDSSTIHYITQMLFSRCLVILDSDHSAEHVSRELEIYSQIVTPGSYLIVEDTIIGHPVPNDHGPGPHEAVEKFLLMHPEYAVDKTREKHLLTFNPNGYLRRLK